MKEMGLALTLLGRLDEGRFRMDEAQSLIRKDSADWFDLLLDRAILCHKMGDIGRAADYLSQLAPFQSQFGSYLSAKYLHLLGSGLLCTGGQANADRAEDLAQHSLQSSYKIGDVTQTVGTGPLDPIVGAVWRRMFALTLLGSVGVSLEAHAKILGQR